MSGNRNFDQEFRDEDRAYVLDHLEDLVVKLTHGSGGYGMLVGPHASRKEREAFAALPLEVNGVIWSLEDARALVNGHSLAAGDPVPDAKGGADLRVEVIEEDGVVFNYRGGLFRKPVEMFSSRAKSGDAAGDSRREWLMP